MAAPWAPYRTAPGCHPVGRRLSRRQARVARDPGLALHRLAYPPGHGRALRRVRADAGVVPAPITVAPGAQDWTGPDGISTLAHCRSAVDHRWPQCGPPRHCPITYRRLAGGDETIIA